MPRGVLHACKDFQEALEVRNTIAGGLGEASGKPTSIPQGDPMSMMIISLILRTWVVQMEMSAVTPRILADDLQLLCTGNRHLVDFEYVCNETHTHFTDMGAKLAPKKSIIFSSDETSRRWLRTHRWRRVGLQYKSELMERTWEPTWVPRLIEHMVRRLQKE